MPVTIPIEVQVPPMANFSVDMIDQKVKSYAQSLVDEIISRQSELPRMSFAELDQCIPVTEAFSQLREKYTARYNEGRN